MSSLIEEGRYGFVKADTLEELAEKINVPYENLKASLDTYNEHVKNGDSVDELGRELLTTALEGGPWYAYPRAPAAHHTMGGVKINTDAHVIGTSGDPIPGLYAAGEVTGGIHGGNRLGGNAIVDFTVFGRIAGQSVVEGKEAEILKNGRAGKNSRAAVFSALSAKQPNHSPRFDHPILRRR